MVNKVLQISCLFLICTVIHLKFSLSLRITSRVYTSLLQHYAQNSQNATLELTLKKNRSLCLLYVPVVKWCGNNECQSSTSHFLCTSQGKHTLSHSPARQKYLKHNTTHSKGNKKYPEGSRGWGCDSLYRCTWHGCDSIAIRLWEIRCGETFYSSGGYVCELIDRWVPFQVACLSN